MFVVRLIEPHDIDQIEALMHHVSGGMDNLPRERREIVEIVECTEHALQHEMTPMFDEKYFFVLEDLQSKRVIGFSGIFATTGYMMIPHYYYRIETVEPDMKVLRVTVNESFPSEVCALYLDASYRGGGLGKLLSLSRLLFIACHRDRFRSHVKAEMRAYTDKRGKMVFWEHIAKPFAKMEYEECIAFVRHHPHELFDLLPKYPLYIATFSSQVRRAIGRPHSHAVAAVNMLKGQGLTFAGDITLFDGGPNLAAKTDDIQVIKSSRSGVVAAIVAASSEQMPQLRYIITSGFLGTFRCCLGMVEFSADTVNQVKIESTIAHALQVAIGDTIRFAEI